MSVILQPWHRLLVTVAGWINRMQQRTIEYLITENQILKEKRAKKRILLNDDQRRHLARAQGRQGFGWKRWSRKWLYDELGLSGGYRVKRYRPPPKVAPT